LLDGEKQKMVKTRKIISQIVGGIQCGLGGLVSAFAFLIYASSSIRDIIAVTSEEVYLYMFIFFIFGLFSILSGLLLVRESGD